MYLTITGLNGGTDIQYWTMKRLQTDGIETVGLSNLMTSPKGGSVEWISQEEIETTDTFSIEVTIGQEAPLETKLVCTDGTTWSLNPAVPQLTTSQINGPSQSVQVTITCASASTSTSTTTPATPPPAPPASTSATTPATAPPATPPSTTPAAPSTTPAAAASASTPAAAPASTSEATAATEPASTPEPTTTKPG